MPRRSRSLPSPVLRSATLLVLAAFWLLGPAAARALTFDVAVEGGDALALDEIDLGCETSGVLTLCGDQADPQTISGTWSGDGFDLTVSGVLADMDPIITVGFGFTNTSLITSTYTIVSSIPIVPLGPSVQIAGSAGFTLTDGTLDSATLANDPGIAIFQGQIDGLTVASAGNPFSLSCNSSGILPCTATDSVTIPVDTLAQGAAATIGIRFQFSLSPGDSIGVSGSFVVQQVPEPGVGLLLGTAFAALGWVSRKGRLAATR